MSNLKTMQIPTIILNEILNKKRDNTPFIIGINGIDASGKTQFTIKLEKFLTFHSVEVQVIHLDDFQNPKRIRYVGSDEPLNYYQKSFDFNLLRKKLLQPIQQGQSLSFRMTHLDIITDTYSIEKIYKIGNDSVVILEGVFLFRPELIGFLDYKIFLDISFEEAKKRIIDRDVIRFGNEVIEKIDRKYHPAQRKYLHECKPKEVADMVINNMDWSNPIITQHRKKVKGLP
jgi:uridine kinase